MTECEMMTGGIRGGGGADGRGVCGRTGGLRTEADGDGVGGDRDGGGGGEMWTKQDETSFHVWVASVFQDHGKQLEYPLSMGTE